MQKCKSDNQNQMPNSPTQASNVQNQNFAHENLLSAFRLLPLQKHQHATSDYPPTSKAYREKLPSKSLITLEKTAHPNKQEKSPPEILEE
jgi:hypothetical protein